METFWRSERKVAKYVSLRLFCLVILLEQWDGNGVSCAKDCSTGADNELIRRIEETKAANEEMCK